MAMVTPLCPDAEVANKEDAANEKRMPPSAVSLQDEVLYVLAKDGSIRPGRRGGLAEGLRKGLGREERRDNVASGGPASVDAPDAAAGGGGGHDPLHQAGALRPLRLR